MIPLKIITKEEAGKLGLTKRPEYPSGSGGLEYVHGVIGTVGPDGTRETGKIVERFRIHKETGVKEILFETKEWKKEKKDKKINEYKLDKIN